MSRPTSAVRRRAPVIDRADLCVIPDAVRSMGLSFFSARGSGKSHTLGRFVAWQDFYRGVPTVILDPLGGTIDEFLDKILRRPLAERIKLWQRVRYINMAGQDGFVFPWPIYYQAHENERLAARAQRFVDVLAHTDPDLARASIQGMNALAPLAQAAGIILAGLSLGVTELWSLLTEQPAWESRLAALASVRPETVGAVAEIRGLWALSPREQANRTASLKSKLSLFRFHPNFQAIFGATEPALTWSEVVRERRAVLLDFRGIESPAVKKFCLLWIYNSLVTFIKLRGHGRHTPVSFIIDELSYLVGSSAVNADLLTADLDELINRIARSHALWLTVCGQEIFQLPEGVRKSVLSLGTVLFGQTSDPHTAEMLSYRYVGYNPYKIKKTEPVYGMHREQGFSAPRYGITHYRTTEYTLDEQNYLNSRVFLQLQKFHFMLGRGQTEGALPTMLVPVTVERMDAGQYPDKTKVDLVRSQLTARDGIPEATLLSEIAARTKRSLPISGSRPPVRRESHGSDGEAPAQSSRTSRPHDTRHTASPAPAHTLGQTEATETAPRPRPPAESGSQRPRPTPVPSAPPPIRRHHPDEHPDARPGERRDHRPDEE